MPNKKLKIVSGKWKVSHRLPKHFQLSSLKSKFKSGFSFIELLVVVAILGLLISLTYASFSNFHQSTRLSSAALQLKSDLRYAQNKALAGDKSTLNCSLPGNTLVGWYLEIDDGASSYLLNGICKNPANVEIPESFPKVLSFPAGVTADIPASNNIRVLFRPLDREVTVHRNVGSSPYFYNPFGTILYQIATPFTMNLVSDSGVYQITIQSSGEISEKKL